MKPIFMIALFVWSFTPLAVAQEFDVAKVSSGSEFRWKAHNGNTFVKMLGPSGQTFKLQFRRDGSRNSPLKGTLWANRNGEIVKSRFQGITTKYSPHDCSLTRGRCDYIESNTKLGKRKMIRTTTVSKGIWKYELYHTKRSRETMIERGSFSVDSNGFNVDRTYETWSDGNLQVKAWSRRK